MKMSEVDSFIGKFKYLWHSGRSASLTINSEAGKVRVTLSVEVDEAPHLPAHHQRSRNGPAKQRRRLRREAARENAKAEEARKSVDAEKLTVVEAGSTAKSNAENALDENQEEAEKILEADVERNMTVVDEVCRDKLYAEKAKATDENSDSDMYNFEFVDFLRESEAQDMINFFEEKIAINFELFKVEKRDQVYKMDKIIKTRTGFEFRIKVKKHKKELEEAINHIETYSGWPLQMKLKNISR